MGNHKKLHESKDGWQVSPRITDPHTIEHTVNHHSEIGLVINPMLEQGYPSLRPQLISEHESGHCKLVLLLVLVSQFYEFALINQ